MNKLNQRLTLIANISVVLGIIFLAVELQRNTQAIQAQTRDAVTEKQMEYLGWVATNLDLAGVQATAQSAGLEGLDTVAERQMFSLFSNGMFREWENSYSQYERGLFTAEEFEPRMERWRLNMAAQGYQEVWSGTRMTFAPSFRAEIDRIVAEVGG